MAIRSRNSFCIVILIVLFIVYPCSGFSQNVENLPEDIKKTIDLYVQKGDESDKNGDANQASFYYHQAGNLCWSKGYPKIAIDLFVRSLAFNEKLVNLNGISVLHTKLGLIYTEIKDFKSALEHFKKSLEVARNMGRKQEVASALINVANSYCELEKYSESLTYLVDAESIAKDNSDIRLLRSCYSLMTKVYDELGDHEKSTEYFNLFAAITKKIQQDELQKKESEAQLMVDKANSRIKEVESVKDATEKELKEKSEDLRKVEKISFEKQLQIDLLSKETALQLAEIRQQKLMRNVYLIIIVSGILITGLLLYGYFRIRKSNALLKAKNIVISRQKNEIELQAQDLKELNALKDKLFSIISHDLRSPLFSLISMLKFAKEGHFTVDEQKEILNELSRNVEYNTELLENLLKWSSSQMKGNGINLVKFDISQTANAKLNLYSKTASQKGIRLVNIIAESSEVYADKDMIDLVMRNLISNAIKFSDRGDEVVVSSSRINGMMQICIADTGIGISSNDIEKLFGKHVFSKRGTLNEKGTGLGLILSRDFISLNGGSIWVESELNKGSRFYFTLPVKD